MKKALHISIAQTLFTIEEDAYAKLDEYLSSIRAHFAHTEGKDDIISDIESRISEQFSELKHKIITLENVEMVIASMGKVEDFDSETGTEADSSSTPASAGKTYGNKKLYRNPDDKILAGVCSGLAVYLNTDPLWIRIAFVLLALFANGLGIIVYIVLALVVPEAKTTSQKLEMEGSPVTLDTLSKNVKEKAEEIRVKHGSRIKRILSVPFVILKKIIDFLVRYVGPFIRIAVGIILLILSLLGILVLSFLAPLILSNGSVYVGFPITEIISPLLFYFTVISTYVALVIPCIVIFMSALGIIGKRNLFTTKLGFTFFVIWFIAIISAGVTGFNTGYKVDTYVSPMYEPVTKEIPISGAPRHLQVNSGIHVTLVQGTTTSLSVSGSSNRVNAFKAETNDESLNLDTMQSPQLCLFCNFGHLRATITLPDLSSVSLKEGSRINVDSWTSSTSISVSANQGSYGNFTLNVPEITASATQGSRIILNGTADHATLTATQGSTIDIRNAQILVVESTVNQGSRITSENVLE